MVLSRRKIKVRRENVLFFSRLLKLFVGDVFYLGSHRAEIFVLCIENHLMPLHMICMNMTHICMHLSVPGINKSTGSLHSRLENTLWLISFLWLDTFLN